MIFKPRIIGQNRAKCYSIKSMMILQGKRRTTFGLICPKPDKQLTKTYQTLFTEIGIKSYYTQIKYKNGGFAGYRFKLKLVKL